MGKTLTGAVMPRERFYEVLPLGGGAYMHTRAAPDGSGVVSEIRYADGRLHDAYAAGQRVRDARTRMKTRDSAMRRLRDGVEDLPSYSSLEEIRAQQRRRMDPAGFGPSYRRSSETADRRRDENERCSCDPDDRYREAEDRRRDAENSAMQRPPRHRFRGVDPRRRDEEEVERRNQEREFSQKVLGSDTARFRKGQDMAQRLRGLQRRHDRQRVIDAFRRAYPQYRRFSDAEVMQLPEFVQMVKSGEFDGILGLTSGGRTGQETMVRGTRDAAPRRITTLAQLSQANRQFQGWGR